eukprot:8370148-Karenia_brevis.AAC.1
MSGEKQHTHQHGTEPEPEEDPDPWQEQERELSWIEIAAYTRQWPVEGHMQNKAMRVIVEQLELARAARTKEAHSSFKQWLENSIQKGSRGAHKASKMIEEEEVADTCIVDGCATSDTEA